MKLARGNKYMFRTVKCHAYLRRIKDGKWFAKCEYDIGESRKLTEYVMIMGEAKDGTEISKDCEEYDGSEFLDKTYYERIEKEFCGVVVATKLIETKKRLYADTAVQEYGLDYYYIGKETLQAIKCAQVYYANGKSRLVPLADLEIMEENDG